MQLDTKIWQQKRTIANERKRGKTVFTGNSDSSQSSATEGEFRNKKEGGPA
jgi:hypothetical protein